MRTLAALRGTLVVMGGLLASCTFAGLGDYAVDECDPRVTSAAEDVCGRLGTSDPCAPFQCGPAGQCVQAPRDADRDGDPDLVCGGTDCDDANRAISRRVSELCDGQDNDCNGLVDDGVLEAGAPVEVDNLGALSTDQRDEVSMGGAGAIDTEIVGASVIARAQGTCIRAVRLPGGAPGAGCSLLSSEPSLSPRQPFAQRMESLTGVVFVSASACPQGRLMYRVGPSPANVAGPSDLSCQESKQGTALPSFAPVPASSDALVAWYRTDLRTRDDRYGGCQDAAPAPLVLATMRQARTGNPSLGSIIELVSDAVSVAPPVVLPVASVGGALVMSPVGGTAMGWWIWPGDPPMVQEPAAWVPGFAAARAISAALRQDNGLVSVLAVGEIGCIPQSLRISFGTLDSSGVLSFGDAVELVPSRPNVLVGKPAAQWVAARGEWQVTWATRSGATAVMAQRLTPDGQKIGEPFEVAAGALLGATGSDGNVYAFEPGVESNRFWQTPVGCGR